MKLHIFAARDALTTNHVEVQLRAVNNISASVDRITMHLSGVVDDRQPAAMPGEVYVGCIEVDSISFEPRDGA